MEQAQQIGSFLSAIGIGGFLTAGITGLFKWLSGASHRERVKNADIDAQRIKAIEERDKAREDRDLKVDKAEKERDEEAEKRREAEEHVAILQRQLILAGMKPIKRENVIKE
jgi:hypothetical protein